ncbi:MAG TPA: ERCC4 domain-containing protein [Candidatus Bathyarchaeia archaeon]|jgi:ERCC4-type nuclease|nr:ERCC4 domain-containing protein [Candidatus Bathyarchaeia archaeon]
MSGTETLLPFLKEKKTNEQQQPTIIVDSREANTATKIVKGLRERGVDIKTEQLEKGDYILSDICAVERKTVKDFVYTLTHRYLFEQLFRLKEVYPKALILLEGYLPIIYKYSRIQPAAVWGAMFSLVRNGIPMVTTTSYKETIDFLYVAARQEQIVEKRVPTVHAFKNYDSTSDAQIYFVASLPNVGREKAMAILKSYQTPLNALINVDDWSEMVRGLGPIISNKAKEVLRTPFKE